MRTFVPCTSTNRTVKSSICGGSDGKDRRDECERTMQKMDIKFEVYKAVTMKNAVF
jgi:hypothetical protein